MKRLERAGRPKNRRQQGSVGCDHHHAIQPNITYSCVRRSVQRLRKAPEYRYWYTRLSVPQTLSNSLLFRRFIARERTRCTLCHLKLLALLLLRWDTEGNLTVSSTAAIMIWDNSHLTRQPIARQGVQNIQICCYIPWIDRSKVCR
jgi:hypothetical protein